MINTNKFQFAQIDYPENIIFDGSLESFYEKGIEGTIRENLQNSIDAKLDTKEKVIVKIVLDEISKNELPGIDEAFKHIDSLVGHNEYVIEKVNYMKEKKNERLVKVITMEDLNTKGLSGAKYGQSDNPKHTFGSYAYRKGVHNKVDDVAAEISRGGSHGIGKISNNAVSDINLMYFSNCDEFGEKHVSGNIHLIEHGINDKYYRSTGYFSHKDNHSNKLYPYKNEGFSEIFRKDQRGLKIIIPYLREDFSKFNNIVTAVCDNFFVSILEEKVEVQIIDKIKSRDLLINRDNIQEIVNDREYYITDKSEIKKVFTPLYISTLNEIETPEKLRVKSKNDTYEFDLYFKYDEEIPVARVGIVRSMGMKIVDYKVERYIRRPYSAVLIGGPKEDGFLKTMENESHTQLSADNIKDHESKMNATRFLRNLTSEMQKIIEANINRNSISSGELDTSHILSELDTSFSNSLSSSSKKIKLGSGSTLVQRKPKERRNPGNTKKRQHGDGINKQRNPRKLKPSNDDESVKESIILPNSSVQRISLTDKEIIKFNFEDIPNSEGWLQCDITFVVVDGMGKEYLDEARLTNNYMDVRDGMTDNTYDFNDFKIKNVKIRDNSTLLNLMKHSEASDFQKYLYKIEVKENDL